MSNKGKILVVDDDRLVLATLTYGLAQAGFEVIDADNGDDAILLAREHRPELALLDIRMEGLSGFDVAAYLREYLHIPFMFLSAFADEETVAKVKELGAVAYLVKPLDIHQIVPAVEAAFANRKMSQAASSSSKEQPSGDSNSLATDLVLQQMVALAIGVLMHRYSLNRQDAYERLQKLSSTEGRDLETQARMLVEAVEMLAQPANVK
ncbi:ANTAR domain-containing response regulator [Paucibacter sp. Y2R2-4]|uniref:ANTAR domain-containing response regulator n=1 Tax=Paucibacter sp. Y2R2-4 TaxID=2893553 RepID=UPI0021E5025D|nr:response regulator [Paucibacter sp. Y2R2-4]MCV2351859.1 response regulator [Paucibacter sp. Y2R2-4]